MNYVSSRTQFIGAHHAQHAQPTRPNHRSVTIRKHFGLTPADGLEWVIEGNSLRVIPVRADPIAAFRGQGKGGATKRLIAERCADSETTSSTG
jgi:hypothetical protein